jgi:hypothetical protein
MQQTTYAHSGAIIKRCGATRACRAANDNHDGVQNPQGES